MTKDSLLFERKGARVKRDCFSSHQMNGVFNGKNKTGLTEFKRKEKIPGF